MTDDLTALRKRARGYQKQGWLTHTVRMDDYLALLDRLERAERELEVAMAPHSDCVESGERAGAQMDDLKSRAERAEAVIAHLNEWLDENRPLRCTIDYGCEGDAQDDYAVIKRILAALDTGKEKNDE